MNKNSVVEEDKWCTDHVSQRDITIECPEESDLHLASFMVVDGVALQDFV